MFCAVPVGLWFIPVAAEETFEFIRSSTTLNSLPNCAGLCSKLINYRNLTLSRVESGGQISKYPRATTTVVVVAQKPNQLNKHPEDGVDGHGGFSGTAEQCCCVVVLL